MKRQAQGPVRIHQTHAPAHRALEPSLRGRTSPAPLQRERPRLVEERASERRWSWKRFLGPRVHRLVARTFRPYRAPSKRSDAT